MLNSTKLYNNYFNELFRMMQILVSKTCDKLVVDVSIWVIKQFLIVTMVSSDCGLYVRQKKSQEIIGGYHKVLQVF